MARLLFTEMPYETCKKWMQASRKQRSTLSCLTEMPEAFSCALQFLPVPPMK